MITNPILLKYRGKKTDVANFTHLQKTVDSIVVITIVQGHNEFMLIFLQVI
jgi:hypothetical protein